MFESLFSLASPNGFMPHGHCYLWGRGILWLHVTSDAFIAISYYSIPLALAWFVRRRRDIDFRWMFLCFAAFILACGTTHLMEIWNVWHGDYWASGFLKALTAAFSILTAILLARLMPRALALPSPTELRRVNSNLLEEVSARTAAEERLQEANRDLELRVNQRTAELLAANSELQREIAERQRGEVALDRLAAIVESSSDAIVGKDLRGCVTTWNEGATRMFGFEAEEMIGQPIMRIVPADLREEEEDILARIQKGERVEPFDTRRLRRDGVPVDVSVSVSPICDAAGRIIGASKVGRDITARKRAETEQQKLTQLIEHSPDLISVADLEGQVTFINRSGRKMIGLDESAPLDDLSFADYVPPDWQDFFRDTVMAEARERGEWQGEMQLRNLQAGEVLDVYRSTFLLHDTEGKPIAFATVTRDITSRKRAARALRDNEIRLHEADRRLAEIVQGMTEACFALDTDWKFTFVNDRCESLLKHTREQLIGRTIWVAFQKLVGTSMEANYRRAMTERVPVAFEVFSPVADRWLDIRLFPTAEGLAAFLLDIDDRKESEVALRESEARMRLATDATGVGIWEWEVLSGRIHWDPSMFRIYGIEPTADGFVTYSTWADSVLPEDLPEQERLLQAAVQGHRRSERAFRIKRKTDGEMRQIEAVETVRANSDGVAVWVVGTNLDVTDRRHAEEEIRALNSHLEHRVEQRTAQLKTANKELEAFSYSVSHDLRAPLRAVDGFSQAVLEDYAPALPDEGQRYLRTIREAAQKMGNLIDDLLTFSRLSRAPVNRQEVNLEAMVGGIVSDLAFMTEGRKVEMKIAKLPPCLADAALLRQVWVNLISNALKYSRQRAEAVIEIEAERAGDETVYSIRDNGTGFDMRYADKLFGVFQRLHRAEDYEGTGVGLAIVQRVVLRHGGRVWADATPGVGATFYFSLPHENAP